MCRFDHVATTAREESARLDDRFPSLPDNGDALAIPNGLFELVELLRGEMRHSGAPAPVERQTLEDRGGARDLLFHDPFRSRMGE
jgi:hypothetical protein